MFALLETEAAEGVDLVAWAEVMVWLGFAEESAWVERVQKLAHATGTTFALGLGVFDPQRNRPYENKLLIVNHDGNVIVDYLKAKPTPGAWHVVGDGKLPVVTMPWGLLSGAICFDFDFPRLFQQVGRDGVQVVLAPSFDDDRVRHMHARMATMRALEEGFSLVRPTSFGVSTVVDPYGRITAYKDAYAGGGFVLRNRVPVYNTATLYAQAGDAFGYLCLVGFGIFIPIGLQTGRGKAHRSGEGVATNRPD
jgi:apolipoprotein N-acyltransferase